MINKVILIGNLGADPIIRAINSNNRVATLSIATSETWVDKNTKEKKTKTEWHRVVIFNEYTISFIENYVTKGAKLYIEGALQTNKYTDQEGVDKYTTQVVVSQVRGQVLLLDKKENSINDFKEASKEDIKQSTFNNLNNNNLKEFDDEFPF